MLHKSQSSRDSVQLSRRGSLTVEMSFVLPILFVVIFGCLEFSRMNMIRNSAKNAAYKAARSAIVPGATATSAQTMGKNLMNAIGVSNATVTVAPNPITSSTTTVTVTVQTNLNGNLFFTPMFLKNKTFTTTCTLNREDY